MRRAAAVFAVLLALAPGVGLAQGLPPATEARVAAALGAEDYFEVAWMPSPEGDLALAVAYYPMPGGNSAQIASGLFRIGGGKMALIGPVDIFGDNPRDAEFRKDRILVTTTMPKPGDPRCCPTGSTRWTIDRKTLKVSER